MYKVLLIDDEVLVRVGLKMTIDWETYGFSVVAEASNGEQGYEQYIKHNPDVIITDIKMPKRDGLWLIEEIRKSNPDISILVLTCYDEFSFARKALKVGADDYILKTEIEDEELIQIMKKMKDKLDKSKGTGQHSMKLNLDDMRRTLLNDLIKSDFSVDDIMLSRSHFVQFTPKNTRFAFVSFWLYDKYNKKYDESKLKRYNHTILNIIYDQLRDKNIDYIYNDYKYKFTFFLSSPHLTQTEMRRIFIAVQDAAKQYFDTAINIIFTDTFDDIHKAAIEYNDFILKEQILFYNKHNEANCINAKSIYFNEADVFELKKRFNTVFLEFIGKEDLKGLIEYNQKVSEFFISNTINPMIVKIFYSNLVGDVYGRYGGLFKENDNIMNHEYYHYKIVNSDSIKNIVNILKDFIESIINEMSGSKYNTTQLIVNRALQYIETHFEQKISLEDVAEELNLSKHYLCSLFKKETGKTMSHYINHLRIEKAKNLMLLNNYKIKELFDEVGFSNQQYFSKVFKKYTGMTIMEYKESKRIN